MSYLGQEISQILPGNVAIGGANMGMVPLFSVQWCPSRSAIWAGYVPADGQELSKSLYPDADAGIQAGNVPIIDEVVWQADNTKRGMYVANSSVGKFRVPDMNGKSLGSLGAVFLRGDGTLSSETNGVIQKDEFRSHAHQSSVISRTGAQEVGFTDGTSVGLNDTRFSGGDETRPLNVTGCWVIKLFGSVTNAGSTNAAQLATEYANIAGRIDGREGQLGWGQTWQNVTSNRLVGVNYTNTTGKPIMVNVEGNTDVNMFLTVDDVKVSEANGTLNVVYVEVNAIVPPGGTYKLNFNPNTGSIVNWAELR